MNINADGLVGTIDIGPCEVEDWRECAITMRAGGFSAEYTCSVRDEEMRHFLSQLEDALARLGQAVSFEFQALERGFAFEIEMGRGGHVDGKYRFERDWRRVPCLPLWAGMILHPDRACPKRQAWHPAGTFGANTLTAPLIREARRCRNYTAARPPLPPERSGGLSDRKSTRLNSSHLG